MITIRSNHVRSWSDSAGAVAMGLALAERLERRYADGRPAVFVTLTYRRDEWDGPQSLWRAQSEQRHVRRFIERLAEITGDNYTGRWFCKLEFQTGGWVHWHLLIDAKRIEHSHLQEAWQHGFVWVERATTDTRKYLCKYVSKAGDLPAFILAERARSFKVVRVSRGFWDEIRSRPEDQPVRRQPLPFYRTLGQVLEARAASLPLRAVCKRGGRVVMSALVASCGLTLTCLCAMNEGKERIEVRAGGSMLHWLASREAAGREAAAAAERVHLIKTTRTADRAPYRPDWLVRYFEDVGYLTWHSDREAEAQMESAA